MRPGRMTPAERWGRAYARHGASRSRYARREEPAPRNTDGWIAARRC